MSLNDTTVCNTDLLQSAKYILSFPRLTSTQFFCQTINIPGLSVSNTVQDTPFLNLSVPGDKIEFDPLVVEFLIDEELQSWTQIHDWIRSYTKETQFEDYKNLKHLSKYSEQIAFPQYADLEITTLSANNKSKVKIYFIDAFPISLSGIPLDIRISSEKTITATATFKYKRYDIVRI